MMMSVSRKQGIFLSLVVLFLFAGPQLSSAYDDITREHSQAGHMGHKLGRGLINVLTGWMEIPKTIAKKWRETDPATGFVLGTIQGIGWGYTRTVAGVYDIFTFPFPAPDNYDPLLRPEFVLPSIWGAETPIAELDTD